MIVTSETRTVYSTVNVGRRYMTRRAAYHAEARWRLASHCECSEGDTVDIGVGLVDIPGTETTCRWHDLALQDYQERVLARWARLLAAADRRAP